jgi:hypothetical protein
MSHTSEPTTTDAASHTKNPEIVLGALEDGIRPSPDPDDWDRLITVVTGQPCPECGTAVGVSLGPPEAVDDHAAVLEKEHDTPVPEDWQAEYDHPVYLYCDAPRCPWHAAAEWADLRPVFETMLQRDAPDWRDRVNAARRREGGELA